MKTSITVTLTADDVNNALRATDAHLKCRLIRHVQGGKPQEEAATRVVSHVFQAELDEGGIRQACIAHVRTVVKIEPGAVTTCKLDYDNAGHVSATVNIDRGALVNGK